MATVVIKTNAGQVTEVLIKDLGIVIPGSGGQDDWDTKEELQALVQSQDLTAFLTDDAYGVGSSTLLLNNTVIDIDQAEALEFLSQALKSAQFDISVALSRDVGTGLIDGFDKAGETWVISRNPNDTIASLTNGVLTKTVNRDGNGAIISVVVS